ncbi:cupin domain-containing protein [Flavobacterium sp. HJJ]|uniref:cupin domain-containing protein n=1 Tax=Flavobacterium sp. HJJ TaxID=2783792 RepID=UPI00188C3C57|nr:cupin domain-containing protein [Flavobacterium sp. HJJ]MBF4473769.1 cupin domain-containing protein [Flavobacterium sp. HJJ]
MDNIIKMVDKNKGEHISVVGDLYRIVISGNETNGAYAMIDMQVPPGGGPPPHSHSNFHESFLVIDGEVEFKTETGKYTAKKGDFINVPVGGAVHSFKNISNKIAHLVCTVVPAGLDEFFKEIGKPVQAGEFLPNKHLNEDELNQLVKIAEKYGQIIYPINYLDK